MDIEPWEIMEGHWTPFYIKHKDSEYPHVVGKINFTDKYLHIKTEVKDRHFKDGDRSWRYGDGFLINFITETYPNAKPSPYFYAYGFSRINGESHSVLVCRNGTFFLRNEDFKPDIEVDEELNQAIYDIKIPWVKLTPFHPLIDKTLGINIRYNSQNDDGSTIRIQLVEDDNFESELVAEKKYLPIKLTQSDKSITQLAFRMDTNLVTNQETSATVTIYSNRTQEATLAIILKKKDKTIHMPKMGLKLTKGMRDVTLKIPTPDKTASYNVEVKLNDLQLHHQFYRLYSGELNKLETRINTYKVTADSQIKQSSLNGLAYKLDVLKKAVKDFIPRDDPSPIKRQVDNLKISLDLAETQGHIYSEGYIRTALKSPDDYTLQPYSLVLPSGFDPEIEYKLLVGLHGSGVDEVQFIGIMRDRLDIFRDRYILVSPRGRDLSDFYVGQTEKDVIYMLETLKKMFNITHTIVFGFSMGGYGVWRLTSLYPESFNAAIIGSGTLTNKRNPESKTDIRNQKWKPNQIPYLVMHGTEDRAVPYKPVKEFIDQLKKQGYNITLETYEGAGHGDYNPLDAIQRWMKNQKIIL